MTETFYKIDYTQSGGIIDSEDFNANYPNKKRINNQINAIHQSNQRKEAEKYKHMTLEELREMKIVSNTNGRPAPNLTDDVIRNFTHSQLLENSSI